MNMLTDTSPEAEQFLIEQLRHLAPWQKLQQVVEMNAALRQLSLAGLKARYPQALPAELQRRLAAVWLDRDLVRRAYAWDPDVEGY